MDLQNSSLMTLLQAKMKWAAQRQGVISQNIAHANTPGYAPKDLKPVDFSAMLKGKSSVAALSATHPNHILPKSSQGGFAAQKMNGNEQTLNGNGVDIEDEVIKMADTKDQYQMAVTTYRKYSDMYKTALGKGGFQ